MLLWFLVWQFIAGNYFNTVTPGSLIALPSLFNAVTSLFNAVGVPPSFVIFLTICVNLKNVKNMLKFTISSKLWISLCKFDHINF